VIETLAMIRQAFRRQGKSKLTDPKKVRQVKSKVKSMLIIFSDIKVIAHKEIVLAGQTVNSAYYCDVLQ
jgi:hypothetical protein